MTRWRRAKPSIADRDILPRTRLTATREMPGLEARVRRAPQAAPPASVIGEAISVIEVTYTGHPRSAMVTRGRRGDRREYGVSFVDVDFTDGTETRASWPGTPGGGISSPPSAPRLRWHEVRRCPQRPGMILTCPVPSSASGLPVEGSLVKVRPVAPVEQDSNGTAEARGGTGAPFNLISERKMNRRSYIRPISHSTTSVILVKGFISAHLPA
jgi:hypothetical protein